MAMGNALFRSRSVASGKICLTNTTPYQSNNVSPHGKLLNRITFLCECRCQNRISCKPYWARTSNLVNDIRPIFRTAHKKLSSLLLKLFLVSPIMGTCHWTFTYYTLLDEKYNSLNTSKNWLFLLTTKNLVFTFLA